MAGVTLLRSEGRFQVYSLTRARIAIFPKQGSTA